MDEPTAIRDMLQEVIDRATSHRDRRWLESGPATQQELGDAWANVAILANIVKEMRDRKP